MKDKNNLSIVGLDNKKSIGDRNKLEAGVLGAGVFLLAMILVWTCFVDLHNYTRQIDYGYETFHLINGEYLCNVTLDYYDRERVIIQTNSPKDSFTIEDLKNDSFGVREISGDFSEDNPGQLDNFGSERFHFGKVIEIRGKEEFISFEKYLLKLRHDKWKSLENEERVLNKAYGEKEIKTNNDGN